MKVAWLAIYIIHLSRPKRPFSRVAFACLRTRGSTAVLPDRALIMREATRVFGRLSFNLIRIVRVYTEKSLRPKVKML